MNKALEEKLIGPLEESHTEEQSPKTVLQMELCTRRSKMAARWARTRVWATRWFFFWRKTKWMGAGISEGDPCGTHKPCRCTQWACGPLVHPPDAFLVPKNLKYCGINHTKFSGYLENFYFLVIFYCTKISENRKIIVFFLYYSQ